MDWYLGLDGGGTGCRAVLADRSGAIIGRGAAGPANIMANRDGALHNIMAAADAALAGRPAARVAAALGLAGANISDAGEWLGPMLPFGRSRVVHDAVTSVAGALGPADGVVAAIGTGSVFSRQTGGRVFTIGGWGLVLGDEASGAWIGRSLLVHALHAVDGLAEGTALAAALLDEMGGPAGVAAFAHGATSADFAALAPRILTTPEDPAARRILAEADVHVTRSIARLRGAADLPVVFLGGLGPVFAARLADRWPVTEARGTALDGALRLARELAE